jgi:L-methionine (R)-S-oxide reductase
VSAPRSGSACAAPLPRGTSVLVPDVHAFPGHIACDPPSRSDLVVPLIDDRTTLGLLDLDSPLRARFDAVDQAICEKIGLSLHGASRPRSDTKPGSVAIKSFVR